MAILVFPKPTAAANTPSVYFQEIMWGGTDRSTADEWFVLGNSTDSIIRLDGWRVTSSTTKGDVQLVDLSGYDIQAHGSFLIASHSQHYLFAGGESALAIDPDIVVSSVSLSNSSLQLKLYSAASSEPIDIAGNGKAPLKGSVGSKSTSVPWSAMERTNPSLDGTVAASWYSATTSLHLDPSLDQSKPNYARPNHAGRPTILTTSLLAMPINAVSTISLTIADPDGNDDIHTASLTCGTESITLMDTGLGGDAVAGDRQYSGRFHVSNDMPLPCVANVTDSSNLTQVQSLTLTSYVSDAPIRISEVLPAPISPDEEFVELFNDANEPVRLDGWMLDDDPDGGSKPFSLAGYVVPANGYIVLYAHSSKIAYNNDGDQVVLLRPDGSVKSQTSYLQAPSGKSWAEISDMWQWVTDPTPGTANPAIHSLPTNSGTSEQFPLQTIGEFLRKSATSPATILGTVVALPKMIGQQYFLVADQTGVAQVYKNDGLFPPIELGSIIQISGTRSTTTYARLLISNATQIQLATASPVLPTPLQAALLASDGSAQFVSATATVVTANSRTLVIRSNSRDVTVQWPATEPTATFDSAIKVGDTVTVVGILKNGNGSAPTLTIRSSADVTNTSMTVSAGLDSPTPILTNTIINTVPKNSLQSPITSSPFLLNQIPHYSAEERARIDELISLLHQSSLALARLGIEEHMAAVSFALQRVSLVQWIRQVQSVIVGLSLGVVLLLMVREYSRAQQLVIVQHQWFDG